MPTNCSEQYFIHQHKTLLPSSSHTATTVVNSCHYTRAQAGQPHSARANTIPASIILSALTLLVGRQERHPACRKMGRWWRWALVSPDGVVLSRMVGVSVSVNLPLHRKVQKFSSGTSSPGWSRKEDRKTVVMVVVVVSCLTTVHQCRLGQCSTPLWWDSMDMLQVNTIHQKSSIFSQIC